MALLLSQQRLLFSAATLVVVVAAAEVLVVCHLRGGLASCGCVDRTEPSGQRCLPGAQQVRICIIACSHFHRTLSPHDFIAPISERALLCALVSVPSACVP